MHFASVASLAFSILSGIFEMVGDSTSAGTSYEHDVADAPAPLAEHIIPSYYKDYVVWPQLFIELAIVIDHSLYTKYGSKAQMYARTKFLLQVVNYNFEPLNVNVALVDLEIWEHRDIIPIIDDTSTLFQTFAQYNAEQHRNRARKYDVVLLMTNVELTGERSLGFTSTGDMCRYNTSAIIVTEGFNVPGYEIANTVSHEIGHLLYMKHDDAIGNCKCHGLHQICLMHSDGIKGVEDRVLHWSNCSLHDMSIGLYNAGSMECLKNKPEHLFRDDNADYPACGDGIVDKQEQCDCAAITVFPMGCRHKCCDPLTCKFTKGSMCADGECCDFNTCKLEIESHICRPAANECDLAEHCNETSPECPPDIYTHDGLPCQNGTSRCYNGQCGVADKCKLYYNYGMELTNPECYHLNEYGNASGNCGYFYNKTFLKCLPSDARCGLLQCNGIVNQIPKQYLQSLFNSFGNVTRISSNPDIVCSHTHIQVTPSYGNWLEHDYVSDGTSCGGIHEQKLCFKYKCIDLAQLLSTNSCSIDCGKHGVCSNVGSCICNPGFIGVSCETKQSVPDVIQVDDPNQTILVILILLTTLFSFLIFMASFFVIIKKRKQKRKIKKARKHTLFSSWSTKMQMIDKRMPKKKGIPTKIKEQSQLSLISLSLSKSKSATASQEWLKN